MQETICVTCERQLDVKDRFCDRCGAPADGPKLSEVEWIAAAFILQELKASAIETIETVQSSEQDRVAVNAILVDADDRSIKCEIKVDPVTKKVVRWNLLFTGSLSSR